jgi:group I intron endonuclease
MIYKITNLKTEHFYVGFTTKSLDERLRRHAYCAKYGKLTHLGKAIRKYGIENFRIECIDDSPNIEREIFWIDKLNPRYNLTSGGDGGDTSKSPNYIEGMKNRRSYKGTGNPGYGKRGKDNPKSKRLLLDGVEYSGIDEARRLAKRSFKYVKTKGIFL